MSFAKPTRDRRERTKSLVKITSPSDDLMQIDFHKSISVNIEIKRKDTM